MPERHLRTYGRRKGHKLSPHQDELLRNRLPELRIDPAGQSVGRLASLFPQKVDAVWLEVGFGGGEHLLWQARENPNVGFIGCEPFVNGVVKLVAKIDACGLENVRIFDNDFRLLSTALPDGQIGRVFVLFPDPWPKKRHHKRRLISAQLLTELARIMAPGAELRIASDIGDYICAILLAVTDAGGFKWLDEGVRDWRQRRPDWPETRYERKALKEGRNPVYLRFEKRKK